MSKNPPIVVLKLQRLCTVLTLIGILSVARVYAAETSSKEVDYQRDIQPIFAEHCFSCHGVDEQESGLRLDRRENLLSGGDWGESTVIPGNSEASFLIRILLGKEPDLLMPPEDDPLTAEQIDLLRKWIDQGAALPEDSDSETEAVAHWSLRPIAKVEPPTLDDTWITNPIDAFVLAKLREVGLEPSPPADMRVLIRRAFLTMHGLPPTPEQMQILDNSYGTLVDQLLASQRYGERWAQHWLDVIRWAETTGYETNLARPNAWPYRDWLIRALNDDMPYDQFIFEQVAGDTIGEDAATGFLVSGPANLPGQVGKDEESMRQARQDELDEIVQTVGGAFLGLTMGCARCHSHKFDPIPQRDYYSFQAIFSGVHFGDRRLRGAEDDRWTAQAVEVKKQLEGAEQRLEVMREELGLLPPLTPERHTELFEPIRAKVVRIEIRATNDGGRPTLFEFEIYSAGNESKNVALQPGTRASASSFALENQTRHPDNLIDGKLRTDDRFPWIASEGGPAWVEIELAGAATIDKIIWERGSGFPVEYEIKVRGQNDQWTSIVDARRRMLHQEDSRVAENVSLDGVNVDSIKQLVEQLAKARHLRSEYNRLSAGPQVFAGVIRDPEPAFRLKRGDPMQRLEPVVPDVPDVLGSIALDSDSTDAERRIALARHLTSPENPLTARVMVNRIWQHYFGAGLVSTPSDLGKMGSKPTHPELLDWLAGEFVRSGWSIKHMHRLILNSSTYRQSHQPREEALALDADCRLLWRYPPRRLEAEVLRDSILRVSGKLNLEPYGPGFDFFNQSGGLSDYIPKEEFDENGWRRMVYAKKIRMQQVDVFGAFDCPDAGQMASKRSRSITPIQALNLLNSTFVNRQAGFFADRVRAISDDNSEELVTSAVQLALGRSPTESESHELAKLCEQYGLEQVGRVLFNTNEFVFLQ